MVESGRMETTLRRKRRGTLHSTEERDRVKLLKQDTDALWELKSPFWFSCWNPGVPVLEMS